QKIAQSSAILSFSVLLLALFAQVGGRQIPHIRAKNSSIICDFIVLCVVVGSFCTSRRSPNSSHPCKK
ncbi:MAG: hypothetical protein IKA70_06010, partial [Alistipes sp.]|nr:hypothetical protein [Alistipes sp.]